MSGRRWIRVTVCFAIGWMLGSVMPLPWSVFVAAGVGLAISVMTQPWVDRARSPEVSR